jgi:hypothetical protein
MVGKYASVEEYLADLAEPFRQVGERMRTIIDLALPESPLTLWEGDPTWSLGPEPGQGPICSLRANPLYLVFDLAHGQDIEDPSARLEPGPDRSAQVKLHTMDDVDEVVFDVWLREARNVEIALSV